MATSTHILLLSLLANEERRRIQITDVPFRHRVSLLARRRRDRRIPRPALQSSNESPFVILFLSANAQALITLTGFDHDSGRNSSIVLRHSMRSILNTLKVEWCVASCGQQDERAP